MKLKYISMWLSMAALILCFQNCGPSIFRIDDLGQITDQIDSSSELPLLTIDEDTNNSTVDPSNPVNLTCTFNGQTLNEGDAVDAYLNSSVSSGGVCQKETRVCRSGFLSGSYAYATCSVSAPNSCLFNGQTVANGGTVQAYLSSAVAFGGTCAAQTRTCNNGVLSGSYNFASCGVGAARSCLFNGQTVAHGSAVKGYQNSTAATTGSCVAEIRACSDGTLSGSYAYASCTSGTASASAQACLFNGQTIAHGSSTTGFLNSSVAFGGSCSSEKRTCNNGVLSGSYTFASCEVNAPKSCLFNGQTISHGGSVKAFQNSSVAFGGTCGSETRSCNNGILSGSYSYASCSVAAPKSCLFNGQTVAHGSTVQAFLNSSVNFGATCSGQTRSCNNGVLSGSYSYATCSVDAAKSCLFNGQSIPHGGNVTAFEPSTNGSTCANQVRNCNNGSLSGSYAYASCSVGTTQACLFNGHTIANGASTIAYQASSVPFGSTCASQTRTCANGVLNGAYLYASCSVDGPRACLFNGQTVAHGETVRAYNEASSYVCEFEDRLCTNGVLSGAYTHRSCVDKCTAVDDVENMGTPVQMLECN